MTTTRENTRQRRSAGTNRAERAERRARNAGPKGPLAGVERTILGVPERFMRPCIILWVVVASLVAFGLVMIYSASSITAMNSSALGNDPAYYLKKQLLFVVGGTILLVLFAIADYRMWARRFAQPLWIGMVLVLLFVLTPLAGGGTYGATRWIEVPGLGQFQPSEFAKIAIVLLASGLCQQYFEEGALEKNDFGIKGVLCAGVPLALILLQPDKGTTGIIAVALIVMLVFAGFDSRVLWLLFGLCAVGATFLVLKDSYALKRVMTMLDPWSDYYGSGYQLIQGFYAFGSGGVFGVGIGMSKQKYSYLPMAHNDFIFAVIGEECGLVGTLGVLVLFALIAWAGMRIAKNASDLSGRLTACGCTSLLIIQLLLNVCGVIGIFPLSGKPIPFLSYGGSSILSSLMLIGVLSSVALHSKLPETSHDRERRSWRQVEGDEGRPTLGLVGEATPRSARRARTTATDGTQDARSSFRVVAGGGSRPRTAQEGRPQHGRVSVDERGRRRIDLGPSASERLRGHNGRNGR